MWKMKRSLYKKYHNSALDARGGPSKRKIKPSGHLMPSRAEWCGNGFDKCRGEHRPQTARLCPGTRPYGACPMLRIRGLRPNQLSAVSIKLHLIPHLLMDKINRMVYNDTNRFISYCVRQKEAPWSAGIRSITIWISQKLLPGGAPACAAISARSSSRMIPSSPPAMWAPPRPCQLQ